VSAEIAKIEGRIRLLRAEAKSAPRRALLEELDAPGEDDVEEAWEKEAVRRHREVLDGTAQPIPGDIAFERLRSRLAR
jgi:hypothetical protein